MATLTYVYSDSTCVVGPLATSAEPHSYDLCGFHAQRLTPPVGWDLVRLDVDLSTPPVMAGDDLTAVADAVREASTRGPRRVGGHALGHPAQQGDTDEILRRRHLRVLRDDHSD